MEKKTEQAEKSPAETDSLSSGSTSVPERAHLDLSANDLERAVTEKSHRSGRENATRITTALDWTGPDDPENPENWSAGKKAFHVAYVGFQCFITTFGSSVYSPAIPEVVHRFSVSPVAATLPLTLYVLGLAAGPMVSAPISETTGRRIVYLTLFPISLLFTLGAALAQNFGTLLICRFLAGTIGSGCLAVGAGTNSDLFPPLTRGPVASIFMLAPFAGPAVGPVAGAYLAEYQDWRWTQYIILMLGLFCVIIGSFQKETYKKIILLQRAKKHNLLPPPNPMAALSPVQRLKFIFTVTLARPLMMCLTEPIVAFLGVYTAFNFGVLFCFFGAFPLVFTSSNPGIQVYHFSQGESGLVFLGIGIGTLIAAAIYIFIDKILYEPQAREQIKMGKDPRSVLLPPEQRVMPAIIGSFMLPISLFWFAWTARSSVHWIVPVIATVPFGAGNLLVFFTAVMYQLDSYGPMMGASAMAANGILRYSFGAVFPLFTRQMYVALGVQWATSLLGFVTIALMVLPWVLLKFGPFIRGKSKYATFSKCL